jgi:hypothetical protein
MTDDLLPEKLSPAAKRQRRRYIAEAKTAIEKGDKAYAELGQALWALQDEGLYGEDGLTFPEFVLAEFGISKSNAYRCIEIAKYVTAHPLEPIPSQYAIEAARPKRPKVGTGGDRHPASDQPVPAVIDAEGWEEPEPKALPAPAAVVSEPLGRNAEPDSPGATPISQPEVTAGLTAPGGTVDETPVDWQAVTENVSAHARAVEDATSDHDDRCESEIIDGTNHHSPCGCARRRSDAGLTGGKTDGPLAHALDAGVIDDAARNSANVVKPAEMTQAEYDAWTTKLHDYAKARLDAKHPKPGLAVTDDGQVSGYIAISTPASRLMAWCAEHDLDAIGQELTADQMGTLTKAYEQIRESWTVTHKARKDWSKELRARRPAESNGRPPVASRSGGGLDRREVEPRFKQGKEKVAR